MTEKSALEFEAATLAATAKRKGRTVVKQAHVESSLAALFADIGVLADPDTQISIGA